MSLPARCASGVAVNYAAQLYGALLGICVLPFYRRHLGDEGYGLASFFTLVQSYAQLFDFGISATMLRTMARARGEGVSHQYAGRVFGSLRVVSWLIAGIIILTLFVLSPVIGIEWLNTGDTPSADVVLALLLMAPLIGVRWLCGFYRAVLLGAGAQGTLAAVNTAVSTARYLGVLPIIAIHPRPIVTFALFQLTISIVEISALLILCKRFVVPDASPLTMPTVDNRRYLVFIGLTSAISTGVTQTDKLFLSGMLSLSDFGSSMLAISLAGAIGLVSTPTAQALQPRLTTLLAQGRLLEATALYRGASKVLWHVIAPVALTLAAFADDALFCWTGDAQLAASTGPILALYALGNCVMVIAGMPYLFLSAQGRPELDTLGMATVCIALVPAMYFACSRWGAFGTGVVWLAAMGLYLVLWSPVMHSLHVKGIHAGWIRNIAVTAAVCTTVVLIASTYLPIAVNRVDALLRILLGGALVSIASVLCSDHCFHLALRLLRRRTS